ncbi:non-homologous end-joining DNA ligase [Streptomyces sp. DSM 42041]|uniref:Non-homologous end-joining DNA ligase n=1 Tax=Streptomyces hazeniae TaxID=3075538 RepID=A0ABU2NK58_9ACTN|nr:non-homologous end-joining DNA ligase [Streptomyces sp. DSM 42041]MDT0377367.1 non-homologous end-joining DNA ligase [Streptomyces sp. DSM 42041]
MPITEIDGHRLSLSNLDKVLYPAAAFTKGEAIHYYASVADAVLPHLKGRAVSFLRFPDGVNAAAFFAKNVPPGTPDWVRTAVVVRTGEKRETQVVIEDLATLVWAANLAALELHTHQWRVDAQRRADRIVFDLDPGEGATILDCREVGVWLRDRLAADGFTALAKTSGSKGLHLLAAVEATDASAVSAYAKRLAQEAERAMPERALHRMARHLRAGKVFVDHSQNSWAKTTAAPYTLRARPQPTVSAPVTWEELAAAGTPDDLVFTAVDVPGRVRRLGDLMAPLLDERRAAALPQG